MTHTHRARPRGPGSASHSRARTPALATRIDPPSTSASARIVTLPPCLLTFHLHRALYRRARAPERVIRRPSPQIPSHRELPAMPQGARPRRRNLGRPVARAPSLGHICHGNRRFSWRLHIYAPLVRHNKCSVLPCEGPNMIRFTGVAAGVRAARSYIIYIV